MTKARQLADLGNAYDDGALSNRNLIINGEFLISQRGDYTSATSLTNNTYYLDRFINRNGVAGTIQQTSNMPTGETGKSVKMLTTASGTAQFVLEQFIEPQTWMTSKTYTASCWIKSNTNKCSITLINNGNFADRVSHTGGGDWEKITLTFNIGSTLSDFRIRIGLSQGGNTSISSGNYFEFTQLQLEVGDSATPFEHRSFGDELAKCQRYYQNIQCKDNNGSVELSRNRSSHNEYSGTVFGMSKMRTEPTMSQTGMDRLHKPGIAYDTVASVSFNSHPDGASARVNLVPTSNTTNCLLGWYGANSGGSINFDAEL